MTESSEQRSKRIFLNYLKIYEWTHQISIFYQDYEESRRAIAHGAAIRKRLIKAYPDQAFLWRLILSEAPSSEIENVPPGFGQDKIILPVHTFLTNKRTSNEEFRDFAESVVGQCVFTMRRQVIFKWLNAYAAKIKKEDLFDLNDYFGVAGKINRQSLLGKKHATPDLLFGDLLGNPYPWKRND